MSRKWLTISELKAIIADAPDNGIVFLSVESDNTGERISQQCSLATFGHNQLQLSDRMRPEEIAEREHRYAEQAARREAERDAALEAEVERRLNERLGALGMNI